VDRADHCRGISHCSGAAAPLSGTDLSRRPHRILFFA
jgi:hypothetical protein